MRWEGGKLHHSLKEEGSDNRISSDTFGENIAVMTTTSEWLQSFSPHGHTSRPRYITNLQKIAIWTLQVTSLRIPRSVQLLQLRPLGVSKETHEPQPRAGTAPESYQTFPSPVSDLPVLVPKKISSGLYLVIFAIMRGGMVVVLLRQFC